MPRQLFYKHLAYLPTSRYNLRSRAAAAHHSILQLEQVVTTPTTPVTKKRRRSNAFDLGVVSSAGSPPLPDLRSPSKALAAASRTSPHTSTSLHTPPHTSPHTLAHDPSLPPALSSSVLSPSPEAPSSLTHEHRQRTVYDTHSLAPPCYGITSHKQLLQNAHFAQIQGTMLQSLPSNDQYAWRLSLNLHDKHHKSSGIKGIGIVDRQGLRPTHEDATAAHIMTINDASGIQKNVLIAGVFDGHGSPHIAGFASCTLPILIEKQLKIAPGRDGKPRIRGKVHATEGILAVCRGLGDHFYNQYPDQNAYVPEEKFVSAIPSVTVTELDEHARHINIVCDGIRDVMRVNSVGQESRQPGSRYSPSRLDSADRVASVLVTKASNRGSTDNMTALTISVPKVLADLCKPVVSETEEDNSSHES